MLHRIVAKSLDWGWVRRAVARGVGRWLGRRAAQLPQPWRDFVVVHELLPPAEAVAALARQYGSAWIQRPLYDVLEALADAYDGTGDYLRAGVHAFREELRRTGGE